METLQAMRSQPLKFDNFVFGLLGTDKLISDIFRNLFEHDFMAGNLSNQVMHIRRCIDLQDGGLV